MQTKASFKVLRKNPYRTDLNINNDTTEEQQDHFSTQQNRPNLLASSGDGDYAAAFNRSCVLPQNYAKVAMKAATGVTSMANGLEGKKLASYISSVQSRAKTSTQHGMSSGRRESVD